jgi:FkbM family methyltransferase
MVKMKFTGDDLHKTLRAVLPSWLKTIMHSVRTKLFGAYATQSYSQEGEDILLNRIFDGKKSGFYVDVGAHHPHRFSNTFFFYRRGWRGINIEPNPDAMFAFQLDRKKDINLQIGISDHSGSITYFMFDEPAFNTFDDTLVKERLATIPCKVVSECKIPVVRLDQVLEKYLPPGVEIDFLSIDVEGLDLSVLKSNDWKKYRPSCVLVESLNTSLEDTFNGEIFPFMKLRGYELFAKAYNTLIFRERNDVDAKRECA